MCTYLRYPLALIVPLLPNAHNVALQMLSQQANHCATSHFAVYHLHVLGGFSQTRDASAQVHVNHAGVECRTVHWYVVRSQSAGFAVDVVAADGLILRDTDSC